MSFILDALRKSEHERQRSSVPGISQVPLATPEPQVPRWALIVIAVLAGAALALGGAWWQSARGPAEVAGSPPLVQRSIDVPPPAARIDAPQPAAPERPVVQDSSPTLPQTSLAAAAGVGGGAAEAGVPTPSSTRIDLPADAPVLASSRLDLPTDAPALPSVAALAAEGVVLPSLRLELHAYSEQIRDRFVFINGRKYAEGERLIEGPEVVSIVPRGAVLAYAGRRFILVQE